MALTNVYSSSWASSGMDLSTRARLNLTSDLQTTTRKRFDALVLIRGTNALGQRNKMHRSPT